MADNDEDISFEELDAPELTQEELAKALPKPKEEAPKAEAPKEEAPKEAPKKEVPLSDVASLINGIDIKFDEGNVHTALNDATAAKPGVPGTLDGKILLSNDPLLSHGMNKEYPFKVNLYARTREHKAPMDVKVESDGILYFLDKVQDAYSRQIPNLALANLLEKIYGSISIQLFKLIPNIKKLDFDKPESTPGAEKSEEMWKKVHEKAEEANAKFVKLKEETGKFTTPKRKETQVERLNNFFKSKDFTWDKKIKDYKLRLNQADYSEIKDIIDLYPSYSLHPYRWKRAPDGSLEVIYSLPARVTRNMTQNNPNKVISAVELQADANWAGPVLDQIGALIGMPQAKWASETIARLVELVNSPMPTFPPFMATQPQKSAGHLPQTEEGWYRMLEEERKQRQASKFYKHLESCSTCQMAETPAEFCAEGKKFHDQEYTTLPKKAAADLSKFEGPELTELKTRTEDEWYQMLRDADKAVPFTFKSLYDLWHTYAGNAMREIEKIPTEALYTAHYNKMKAAFDRLAHEKEFTDWKLGTDEVNWKFANQNTDGTWPPTPSGIMCAECNHDLLYHLGDKGFCYFRTCDNPVCQKPEHLCHCSGYKESAKKSSQRPLGASELTAKKGDQPYGDVELTPTNPFGQKSNDLEEARVWLRETSKYQAKEWFNKPGNSERLLTEYKKLSPAGFMDIGPAIKALSPFTEEIYNDFVMSIPSAFDNPEFKSTFRRAKEFLTVALLELANKSEMAQLSGKSASSRKVALGGTVSVVLPEHLYAPGAPFEKIDTDGMYIDFNTEWVDTYIPGERAPDYTITKAEFEGGPVLTQAQIDILQNDKEFMKRLETEIERKYLGPGAD